MSCKHAASVLLPHLNLILAVISGAALVGCEALYRSAAGPRVGALLGELPGAALGALPYAALLMLLLAHFALVAQQVPPALSRHLLIVYCVVGVILAGCTLGVAGAVLKDLLAALNGPDVLAVLQQDATWRYWLRPLLPLLAPQLIAELPEEPVRAAAVCGVSAALVAPVLLLVASVLAVCARPPPTPKGSSRSSSVYYEPTAPSQELPLVLGGTSSWE